MTMSLDTRIARAFEDVTRSTHALPAPIKPIAGRHPARSIAVALAAALSVAVVLTMRASGDRTERHQLVPASTTDPGVTGGSMTGAATAGPSAMPGAVARQLRRVTGLLPHPAPTPIPLSSPVDGLPDPRDELAYSTDHQTICRQVLSGADPRCVTLDGVWAEDSMRISPDRRQILYTLYDSGDTQYDNVDLRIADADGMRARTIVTPALGRSIEGASWSRDGARIVFRDVPKNMKDSSPPLNPDIYLVNADGSGLHRLTQGLDVTGASFTPDGGRVLFTDWNWGLRSVTVDGSDLRTISSQLNEQTYSPVLSPDGKAIACVHDGEVYLVDPNDGAFRQISSVGSLGRRAVDVTWSPDGSYLAFGTTPSDPNTSAAPWLLGQTFFIRANGKDQRPWTTDNRRTPHFLLPTP